MKSGLPPRCRPDLNEAVLESRILPSTYMPAFLGTLPVRLFLPIYRPPVAAAVSAISGFSSGQSSALSLATSTSNTPGSSGNSSFGAFNFGLSAYNTGSGALFGFNIGMVVGLATGPRAGGGSGGYGGESGVSPAGSPGGPPATGIQLIGPQDASSNSLPYLLDSPGRATGEMPAEQPPSLGGGSQGFATSTPAPAGPAPFNGWRDQLIHPQF